jgi:hypothetical protein
VNLVALGVGSRRNGQAVPHVFEQAPSGRSKCRGCGHAIAKETVRFGERIANPFGEGEASLWFHPRCAAYKRPEPFAEALDASPDLLAEIQAHRGAAQQGIAHPRVARFDGVERASSGRASCRSCRETIAKGSWRIRLVFFQDGRFDAGGFIHAPCVATYCGTKDVIERLRCFSPDLDAASWDELAAIVAAGPDPAPEPEDAAIAEGADPPLEDDVKSDDVKSD